VKLKNMQIYFMCMIVLAIGTCFLVTGDVILRWPSELPFLMLSVVAGAAGAILGAKAGDTRSRRFAFFHSCVWSVSYLSISYTMMDPIWRQYSFLNWIPVSIGTIAGGVLGPPVARFALGFPKKRIPGATDRECDDRLDSTSGMSRDTKGV
jgi:hypothetical protein